MNNHSIAQVLQQKTQILREAIVNKQELDNLSLENICELIETYIDHDDYIIEECAIILLNLFDKYNSLENI